MADGAHPLSETGERASQERALRVVIVTGDRAVFEGVAERVVAPAVYGQIAILPRHAPLLAALDSGELIVKNRGHEELLAIGGGFIEVHDDVVTVLADSAERAEEIDVARAEAARQSAELAMRAHRGQPDYAAASQALRRSRVRLKVAERIGRRGA
ncbi:MAG: ATP synthase F1 subunit epsilon [Chloroflexota bacterium]